MAPAQVSYSSSDSAGYHDYIDYNLVYCGSVRLWAAQLVGGLAGVGLHSWFTTNFNVKVACACVATQVPTVLVWHR